MNTPKNLMWKVSPLSKSAVLLAAFAGGALYSAALPPLNWSFAVFISLLPLLWCAVNFSWKFSALCGWVWGLGWALFSYQFLREIEWFTPYLLAPVLALWPMVYAALLPRMIKISLLPQKYAAATAAERNRFLKETLPQWRVFTATLLPAILFTLIEWTRSRLFVWNDFSVTQWRNTAFIQIAALTGSYGIGFLVALINTTIFSLLYYRKKALLTAAFTALLIGLTLGYGVCRIKTLETRPRPATTLRAGLIQCDLTQRRRANDAEIIEAVDVCVDLSEKCAALNPEIIIWPESAVPIPLESAGSHGDYFRRKFGTLIRKTKRPYLAGLLSFKKNLLADEWRVSNSALLLTANGQLAGRYDKIHRVPYGEYIPFRKYLPQFIINAVDMGRDLEPGSNYEPLTVKPQAKASIAICYEGVFGYLMRDFASRNSNLFITLSNDAWYPESSEPEQHLANASIRCVETGLFMIRCGNNGGSGVVTPTGKFTQYIGTKSPRPELNRERAYGVVEVPVYPAETTKTLFVRWGEYFIVILAAIMLSFGIYALLYQIKYHKNAIAAIKEESGK